MAGARVGYAICHSELASAFNKIRNHFGMCRASQVGALEALKDTKYFESTVVKVNEAKKRIYRIALENGLKAIPSATNFVAIDCGAGKDHAVRIMNGLIEHGIFVRMPGVAPLNRCIRVSVGAQKDLDQFSEALKGALKAVSG